MANTGESVYTQIRLPAGLHEYIQKEAGRLGIAQNAFLVTLCELGGRVWDDHKRIDFLKDLKDYMANAPIIPVE